MRSLVQVSSITSPRASAAHVTLNRLLKSASLLAFLETAEGDALDRAPCASAGVGSAWREKAPASARMARAAAGDTFCGITTFRVEPLFARLPLTWPAAASCFIFSIPASWPDFPRPLDPDDVSNWDVGRPAYLDLALEFFFTTPAPARLLVPDDLLAADESSSPPIRIALGDPAVAT